MHDNILVLEEGWVISLSLGNVNIGRIAGFYYVVQLIGPHASPSTQTGEPWPLKYRVAKNVLHFVLSPTVHTTLCLISGKYEHCVHER